MAVLFDRKWRVTVGTVDVSTLSIGFSVMRSIKREPNTAEVTIRNLAETTRGKISGQRNPRLTLRAGYDDPPVLFVGDSRRVLHAIDGVEVVTTIQARDAGRAYQQARMSQSYGPGTRVSTVLREAVDALGVGVGNLSEYDQSPLSGGATAFPDGFVASGPAYRVVDSILRGAGLRWSVQNNALQILRRGQALQTRAVRLASDSGLIESPTKDEKGIVTAMCLIQPGLDPGRRVVLDARLISGTFEVRRVEYKGDTAGQEWTATLELKAVA